MRITLHNLTKFALILGGGFPTLQNRASAVFDTNNLSDSQRLILFNAEASKSIIYIVDDSDAIDDRVEGSTVQALTDSGGGLSSLRVVSVDSTDYPTIKSALVGVVAGDVIQVAGGVYIEDNPLFLPDGVTLRSLGGRESVEIQALNVNQHLIVMDSNVLLDGFKLRGASDPGNAAIHFPAGVDFSTVINIDVFDCSMGVLVEAAAKDNNCYRIAYASGTGDRLCKVGVGGHMSLYECRLMSSAVLTDCIIADGAGAVCHVFTGHFDGHNTTNGIVAINGGVIRVTGGHLHAFTYALRVSVGGGSLYGIACDIGDSGIYDIYTENGVGDNVYLAAIEVRRDKVLMALGTNVQGTSFNTFPGDEGTQFFGSAAFGTHLHPSEVARGGGNSHTRGMHVQSNTNLLAGAWAVHTSEAASASGSTFPAFPGVGANNTLYVGLEDLTFQNIKVKVAAALVPGAGNIVAEYDKGGVWTPIVCMATDADAPYESHAHNVCQRINSEQVRFGDMPGHTRDTLNGQLAYWLRFVIAVGITTVPDIEQIKIGPNRAETNRDGFEEFFGAGEPDDVLVFGAQDYLEVSGFSPKNETIEYSATIKLKTLKTRFQDNAIDGTGGKIPILSGYDTSRPMEVTMDLYPKSVGGDFNMVLTYSLHTHETVLNGGAVGGASEIAISRNITAITIKKIQEEVYLIDISSLVPGDSVAFAYTRDATAGNIANDTLGGDVILEGVHVKLKRWHP